MQNLDSSKIPKPEQWLNRLVTDDFVASKIYDFCQSQQFYKSQERVKLCKNYSRIMDRAPKTFKIKKNTIKNLANFINSNFLDC